MKTKNLLINGRAVTIPDVTRHKIEKIAMEGKMTVAEAIYSCLRMAAGVADSKKNKKKSKRLLTGVIT
jgi:hypothetical protein